MDPCAAGSLIPGGEASVSRSDMRCYGTGSPLLSHDPAHLGACGFNCSLLRYDRTDAPTPCTEADLADGLCQTYCDSTSFPGAAAAPS